jgi:predicted dehydrogenase
MKKLRVGIVGLGPRGRSMIQLAAMFDCVEVVAGCEIRPHNWFEKQWRAPAAMAELYPEAKFFENYDEMLEKGGLDLVIVETGADIHAEFCAKALEKDINVLSDIPLVANLREAEVIWKASQKSKAILSTGANPNEQRSAMFRLGFFYYKYLKDYLRAEKALTDYLRLYPNSPDAPSAERFLKELRGGKK